MVHLANMQTEATCERIAAMLLVEDQPAYRCRRYLDDSSTSCPAASAGDKVNADCRTKMIDWSSYIVDYCGFDRETVSVAVSFVDRFLSNQKKTASAVLSDRRQFQLLFMTALHIAVKIREQMQLDAPLLSKLSRGTYSAHEFLSYEQFLLSGLDWRVNDPTIMDFVREFLLLLPKHGISSSVEERLLECARCQSLVSLRDFKFATTKRSVLALASILNSVEAMDYRDFPSRQRSEFFAALKVAGLDSKSSIVFEPRMWLQEAFTEAYSGLNRNSQKLTSLQVQDEDRVKDSTGLTKADSPVCVSRLSFSQRKYHEQT
mmetsp:Transcript_33613/g.62100  ORF Transcript_33613/g.62100 Transcript_33613/m.62100 type:complete len:318 (-) Transcript_33613:33-986(-)